jgi:hypothetical protein
VGTLALAVAVAVAVVLAVPVSVVAPTLLSEKTATKIPKPKNAPATDTCIFGLAER